MTLSMDKLLVTVIVEPSMSVQLITSRAVN